MKDKAIQDYVFTRHAKFKIDKRHISQDLLHSILQNPEQRYDLRSGRAVVQSRVVIESKIYLI
jgi:hypothetical protein